MKFNVDELTAWATTLLQHGGLAEERAQVVAEALVEADAMGHTTHGLQLLNPYLHALEEGGMAATGEPGVVQDSGSAIVWDGRYLPGPWLMHQAIRLALERVEEHPVVTLVIRRSHHIGCLAVYPERATRHGLMMLLSCSDPANKSVAPYGGIRPVYSPNPLAAGIPTTGDPILIDVSMSTTANGLVMRTHSEGAHLPHPWLLDTDGQPTADPAAFFEDPPATILPLGGLDTGYKGFALGLLVEALTSGLAGFGRADAPTDWGASVFLQILDPEAFGGREAFARETGHLAAACRASETRPGGSAVRLPGERALRLREEQRAQGVRLYPTILPSVHPYAEKFGVDSPKPLVS